MIYTEITRTHDRNNLLEISDADNIKNYISAQIEDPFSNDVNYFKALRKTMKDEKLIDYSKEVLDMIENTYPSLSFIVTEENLELVERTYNIYRFFIKNIKSITYIFLKEYIANNKNRKALTSAYNDVKFDMYPNEEYGKKEYFILVSKIDKIIKDIRKSDISLSEFITYVNKSNDSASYIEIIDELHDLEFIVGDDVVSDILKTFIKSDSYNATINKLLLWVNKKLITPCLKDMGLDKNSTLVYVEDGEDVLTDDDTEPGYNEEV